jgi:hypothetical protein
MAPAAGGSPHGEWQRDGFTISTDPARLDVDGIYDYLSNSYWARGIPRDVFERSLRHALCFGIYEGARQVGFARVSPTSPRSPTWATCTCSSHGAAVA